MTGYSATRIFNGRERTMIDVRRGGPGNSWALLDYDAEVNGVSGGEQGVESLWGTSENGGSQYLGNRRTGNPERPKGQIMIPMTVERFLRSLSCPYDLRWRSRCGDPRVLTDYVQAINYIDSVTTSRGKDKNLRNAIKGDNEDIAEQYDFSAGIDLYQTKVVHLDLSATNIDFDINKVVQRGRFQCNSDCGLDLSGEEEFWCVTDRDSTPGYSGNPTAMVGFTTNSGQTWTFSYINVFTAADATDIVFVGNKVLAVSAQKGVAYATIADVQNGIAKPWTLSSGISSNFPKVLAVTSNNTVWAAGQGGNIYRSTDGGFSFTAFDAGVTTTQTINAIGFYSDDLGYFGANAGVLIQYRAGALTVIPVRTALTGGTTLSANINVVEVPPLRGREVYIGTSGGQIWRSTATDALYPLFTIPNFFQSGNGSIVDIEFAGVKGSVMFVVQSNADGVSRVLRDLSGGALGDDVEIVGDFTTPPNFGINSIATANINFAITVGQVHQTYGFIGQIRKATG